MRYLASVGGPIAILLAVSLAAGFTPEDGALLSSTDYVYLAAQGVERDNLVLRNMSPLELRRLHYLINDERTQIDPQSRTKAVKDALTVFEGHQEWETANPGRLWDVEKR
jgi:hypothetical protein